MKDEIGRADIEENDAETSKSGKKIHERPDVKKKAIAVIIVIAIMASAYSVVTLIPPSEPAEDLTPKTVTGGNIIQPEFDEKLEASLRQKPSRRRL